jgi:hypothetical protein
MCVTCFAYIILLDFVIQMLLGGEYLGRIRYYHVHPAAGVWCTLRNTEMTDLSSQKENSYSRSKQECKIIQRKVNTHVWQKDCKLNLSNYDETIPCIRNNRYIQMDISTVR